MIDRNRGIISFTIISLLIACTMDNHFWNVIEVNLEENYQINAIQSVGDQIIFGGAITQDGTLKTHESRPYLQLSFDNGMTWVRKTDFDFNYVYGMQCNSNVLIVTGMKPDHRATFYKYTLDSNNWDKMILPNEECRVVEIVNQNTFLFKVLKNQFGNTFLKTTDEGKTWEEHTVLMPDKRDIFEEKFVIGNKIWGIRIHHSNRDDPSDFQSLVSIDINSWKLVDEIPLGKTVRNEKGYPINTHWIVDATASMGNVYLLGKDQIKNDKGYVWKVDIVNKKIVEQDNFELTSDEVPSNLFFHNGRIIVKYTSLSSFFPKQTLLYKSSEDSHWKKEDFPDLTYPIISFNDGKLMGVCQKSKIYFKQF
ncbi:MAG: hypothetical protein KF775_13890 [Cyclobacteriaceae bacterium]|nr:hypothetical protein [Cyclobacteriaceae bacterium]